LSSEERTRCNSNSVRAGFAESYVIEGELKTLDSHKQGYFALYESDTIDNDMLVEERINELKSKYDVLANRKSEAERQSVLIRFNPDSDHSEADSRSKGPKASRH